MRYISDVVLSFDGDECLKWPYATNSEGYGHVKVDGRDVGAHRMVCLMSKGSPPSDKHQAAHNCGKGHLGCVNPKHLRWATSSENQSDRPQHGTDVRGLKNVNAKLSAMKVRRIRRLEVKLTATAIGEQLNVSTSAVARAMKGKTWGWLD